MSTTVAPQQCKPAPVSPPKANTTSKVKPAAPQSTAQSSTISTAKSKKDTPKPSNTPSTLSVPAKSHNHGQMKKVSRRASKPIINWFQRKLAGTVRARRPSESRYGTSSTRSNEKQHRRSSVPAPPPLPIQSRTRSNTTGSKQNRAHSLRGTISLNETNDGSDCHSFRSDSDDEQGLSVAHDSLYSPASYLEADEDASVRPLPPSSPPSPAPSRDSSSYLSHSRTFRSMTASTKPTTLLSVDLTGGMAHIAQAPPTPTTPGHRLPPHIRTHSSGPSAGSITFSAIPPPSPTSPSRPSSGSSGARGVNLTAPLYTTHHPRNNPRPSSPPLDDASMLTLASSAFGMPGARIGVTALTLSGRGSIADDSISQWSNAAGLTDSTSHFMMGDVEGLEERYDHDVDASVRALRPRSSRRGSWDSTVSGWSANVALGGTAGAPSPGGVKNKSVWTSGSLRTGGLSTDEILEDDFVGPQEDEDEAKGGMEGQSITNQTNDTASSAPTDGQKSSITVEPASDSTEDAQTPSAPSADVLAATLSLPGSKGHIPPELASTVTLPGSKTGSEIPSPDHASVSEHKSGTSTPTKTELDGVELSASSAALNSEEGDESGVEKTSDRATAQYAPLSPASTTHTEYMSAPSTPAVV